MMVGIVIAKGGLHLREKADANSPILATLPYGTIVDIDAHSGNWYRVVYQSKTGYLYKDYMKVTEVPPKDPPFNPPEQLQPWTKTLVALAIAIIATIIAFSYGAVKWN